MYKITLQDGTFIENLELNGNNFISDIIIPDSRFSNNLKNIIITDGENIENCEDMMLVANRIVDNKSWFIITEKSEKQKKDELLNTNITDIQLALVDLYESIIGG